MKKYKVNIDRTKPSSEEILARRNFDELMKQYQAAPGKVVHKPFWKTAWFAGALATAAIVVVAVIVLHNKQEAVPNDPGNSPVVNGPNTRHADTSSTAGTFLQEKRRIAPPLKGLDVAFSSYKLDAKRGGTISHPSGSKLVFPANSFVDASGNIVSGNVDVRYREFRDPVDVFVAGIPMQYDSAGKTYQFQSAGMMELAAFVNGKVVYLDKTKPVEVQFASKESGSQFSVYEFDTTQGNWLFHGKDRVQPKEQLAGNNVQKLSPEEQKAKKAAAEQVRDHELTEAVKNNPVPDQPVAPLKADKKKNRFSVDFDPREFPEMAAYKNVLFEVDESREKFDTTTFYHTTWESIVLSKGMYEGRYVATVRKGLKVMKADVYPVFAGKNYDEAKKVYDQKFAAYETALNKRTDAENAARTRYENTLLAAGLTPEGLQADRQFAQANTDAAAQVMRVFTISHFGVYNCDTPGNFPAGTNCALNLEDESGNAMAGVTSLYHVDRNLFGLYGYYAGQTGLISSFSFNHKSSNLIWGVREGMLYVGDNDQFVPLEGKALGTVVMKKVDKQFSSAEEMRVFLRVPARI